MAAAAPIATGMAYVGFWRRTGAFIIDAILLSIVGQALASVLFAGDQTQASGLTILIDLAYFAVMWSSTGGGQTVGMRALGIKVVGTDGAQIDVVKGIMRYIGLFISCIALFIGVIWVAFDPRKQGWHDKIAGTFVVKA
jgi:uncharacterized RDD family membrane protein YckC